MKPTFEQTEEFYKQVTDGRITLENLQAFLRNPNRGLFASEIHAPELIRNGWTVVEDVEPASDLDIGKRKPRSFLRDSDKKGYISGPEMRKRAKEEFKSGNIGLPDGKSMLAEQDKIPVEFRDFYIPLPGTLLRASDGRLRVPYLRWYGKRWVLDFGWLDDVWFGFGRLACSE